MSSYLVMRNVLVVTLLAAGVPSAGQSDLSPVANPANWPRVTSKLQRDPAIERRIAALLARMSIEDKVGQMLQVDIASITPKDVETYKVGSVLNGGNSAPKRRARACRRMAEAG
ncbi:hypothetical protein GCM10011529_19050 [Polymorphobacter glacialis]|uniref:Beta-glucosidase n=1 Tax=Sandarakinorhabdus glacialis TaxID=1614636 RepID=A0A916ZT36_9SPHN|nr:hypothetical protein [Polymorphobacter glacialis]GGE12859.1 hypothetical protein GCM10011529_19050 [Polymorphobacter glacialis]